MEQDHLPTMAETNQIKLAKKQKLDHVTTFAVPTSNPFSPLEIQEEQIVTMKDIPSKPPPIYIHNLTNINTMLKDINSLNPGPYKHITINNKLKLNVDTIAGYRQIISYLESNKAEFHTYQLKSEKCFRVVIRGLHPSCDTVLMMEELRGLGFEPSQMLPVHHPLTKVPMPLFFLDLKPNPNNAKIYELTRLYGGVIKVEPPKPKKTVVQCTKCQQFGHTKNYCFQAARCVKCDGRHATERCTKLPTAPPVCTNCKGAHPASYKGCPEHKKLQLSKIHHLPLTRPTIFTRPTPNTKHLEITPTQPATTQSQSPRKLYSEVVQPTQPKTTSNETQDTTLLNTLLSKIDSLIAIIQPLALTLAQVLPKLLKLQD